MLQQKPTALRLKNVKKNMAALRDEQTDNK